MQVKTKLAFVINLKNDGSSGGRPQNELPRRFGEAIVLVAAGQRKGAAKATFP
jgi:hypothetical protein